MKIKAAQNQLCGFYFAMNLVQMALSPAAFQSA